MCAFAKTPAYTLSPVQLCGGGGRVGKDRAYQLAPLNACSHFTDPPSPWFHRNSVTPGAYRRAEPLLRNALELMWREARGPHPYTARCYAVLGGMLARAGKLQEAGTQLQQAVDLMQVRGAAAGKLACSCRKVPGGSCRREAAGSWRYNYSRQWTSCRSGGQLSGVVVIMRRVQLIMEESRKDTACAREHVHALACMSACACMHEGTRVGFL